MAAEVDVLARALADLNVVARSEFKCHCQRKPGRTKRLRSAVYLRLFTV